jgi:HK97 family phage major capsid protein
MNEFILKLLKDWSDPSGQSFKAGEIISLDKKDAELVSQMLLEDIAEKSSAEALAAVKVKEPEDIKGMVKSVVAEAIKDMPTKAAKELHNIQVKDCADNDLSWGYLPATAGRKHTKDEIIFGLSQFAKDVYAAERSGVTPDRLIKSRERHSEMIQKAIKDGHIDKAASSSGMVVDIDSDGGFTVPPEFSMMLLEMQTEAAIVRPRASKMTLGSDTIELPQWKNYDHSSNTIYGGVQAYFKGENATLTESKPTLEEVKLTLNALTTLAYASHKLITFSPQAVGSYLVPAMTDAIAWKEDDKFLNGNGAGMPLGCLVAPCTVEQAKVSGQAADTVVTENILDMYSRLRRRSNASVAWVYNQPELFTALSLLTIDVGTGGAPAGLVKQVPGVPQQNMLGYPLLDSEHIAAKGDKGDINLCDFSEYIVADQSKGPEVAQSMHLKFDAGQEAFRIIKYVDGQPRYSSAFTRHVGSNTTSPFVTLAERA